MFGSFVEVVTFARDEGYSGDFKCGNVVARSTQR
jgi:hypothetical protein